MTKPKNKPKNRSGEHTLDLLKPHVELLGNNQAMLEGCRGVLYYDTQRIEINLGKYRILFLGDDLSMTSLTGDDAVVTGNFFKIEFEF